MRPLRLVVAVVLLLIGLAWIGQGLNLIKGSAMSGSSFWVVVGVGLLVTAGVILVRERGRLAPRT
jgi:glucose dehydrogenase